MLRDFMAEIKIFNINGKVSTTNSCLMSDCRKRFSSYKPGLQYFSCSYKMLLNSNM